MVDRYSLTASANAIHERFAVEVQDFFKPRYNIAPSQLLPVITGSGRQGLSWFYWGRPPHYAKSRNLAEKIINLPSETLRERPVLKKALFRHRCIIPADGFYGWKKIGKKTAIPHRFMVNDQPVFSFAGIWEEFEDDSGIVHTFTIITTAANELVLPFSERMPVILQQAQEEVWLSAASTESQLVHILEPYAASGMSLYTVSHAISNPNNDFPSIILPAPASDQHGNLTLFD